MARTPTSRATSDSSSRSSGAAGIGVGRRFSVRFSGLAADGAAVARVGSTLVAVPYGIPGEEAVVEVTQLDPAVRGRIVAIERRSTEGTTPPCPHFGRCGGCQWQHMTIQAQRLHKGALVAAALARAGVNQEQIRACLGGTPWGYRSLMRATVGERDDLAIAGFHGWGERRLYNIEVCPIQHPTNVRILNVLRNAVRALELPPYDPESGRGLIRGIVGMTGFVTGEALAVISATGPLPDRMAFVRAVLDRVPGLVGILLLIHSGRGLDWPRKGMTLLWGRSYLEDEVLGIRLRLDPTAEVLPNPGTLTVLLDAIGDAAHLRVDDQVMDAFAESGVLPLALAGQVRRTIGVVPDRNTMTEAWAAAARNGIANAVFYTRDPGRVLMKLHERGERTDVVIARPPGEGLPGTLMEALGRIGPARLVYVGRSLAVTGRDLERLRTLGYAVEHVQPLDLFPQTSHVHAVVALHRS